MLFATGISAGAVNTNTGNDVRTGNSTLVNLAETVAVEARTATGRIFALPVEFAGAQGSMPGLDQINFLLPSELRGAGTVDLTVIINGQRSNTAAINVR
jgi:uncharacterized protein (TIGR03437 family)